MNNKNLYWYGTIAKLKAGIGKLMTLFFGIFAIFMLPFSIATSLFLGIFAIGGIFLWTKGSEENFDYQQQSGGRIHKGDGW